MALSPCLFSDDLRLVCTNDCLVGLESYRAGVVSACGTYMITDSSNNTYAPTLALDYVSGTYMVRCLKDPNSGDFCGPIVESYNTTNGLLSLPTNELCTYCTLETLNATLSNPTSYSVALADFLSSAIATCGASFDIDNYNVTGAPGDQVVVSVPFGVNATSAPTVDCTITSAPLPTANYTSATIINYPLPTANYTITYTTSPITAAGVAALTNIADGTRPVACGGYYDVQTVATLVGVNASLLATWNLELSSGSLPPVGSAICILFPEGNYTLPTVPRPTNAYTNATTASAQYYTVQNGDGCGSIETEFALTNSQFDQLNPGLASDCTNVILGLAYCVLPTIPFSPGSSTGPPDNAAPGTITDGCTAYYTIMSASIATSSWASHIDVASNVSTSTGPPSNVAPGMITDGWTAYYAIMSGDTCSVMEDKYDITLTDITTRNPEINSQCTNIQLGLAYCIASNVSTSTGPPSNVAPGTITDGFLGYYTVEQVQHDVNRHHHLESRNQ